MNLAAGSVQSASDAQSVASWEQTFYYETTPLAIVSTTPSYNESVANAPTQIVLSFNKADPRTGPSRRAI